MISRRLESSNLTEESSFRLRIVEWVVRVDV